MIFLTVDFLSPLFDEVLHLRDVVLRQPLHLTFHTEDITAEAEDVHFAAYDDEWNLVGTLLMTQMTPTTYKMRQVAVRPHMQGRGVGRYMVAKVERWCGTNHISTIVLSARAEAVRFYQTMDYTAVGEPYLEIGIEHLQMMKVLMPDRQEV